MVGNAVPVNLAYNIASVIHKDMLKVITRKVTASSSIA